MCAFQSMKSVDNRRHDSHNDLVGTIGDFSLTLSYTNVPPPLKKYKEYSCALTTINIPKDIWCGLILKDHQNEEVTRSFCQLLKTQGACTMQEIRAPTPAPSNNSWHATSSNKNMYWIYKHLEPLASSSSRLFGSINMYH